MAQETTGRLVSVGVDWITAVGDLDSHNGGLLEKAAVLASQRAQEGFELRPWGMSGFSGSTTDGVQFGVRDSEVIVRLSSNVAHSEWRKIYALADHVTRIDFEVTAAIIGLVGRRVREHFREASRHGAGKKSSPAATLVHCNKGGDTVYVGKRASHRFGRIYDKFAESKDPAFVNCLRYEVEFKGRLAEMMTKDVFLGGSEMVRIGSHVRTFFADRGVNFPFPFPRRLLW